MKNIAMLIAFCIPLLSVAQLTGYWQTENGGCYQIRQNGNEIWWAGEYVGNQRSMNVFHGTLAGNMVTGQWCDLPSNSRQGCEETLALKLENNNKLVKVASSAPYNGTTWTKQVGNGCATATAGGTNPVSLPPPVPQSRTNNAIVVPGAVDLAVSSTDIWVGHGQYGVYKIPLSTRTPQSYSSDKMVKRIAVDQNNRPWIIDTEDKIYYHNGSSWVNTNSGQCKDICIDRFNRAWTIDYGWWLKYYDAAQGKWVTSEKNDGRALGVLDENNIIHARYNRSVDYKQNGTWKDIPGLKMEDLALSPNGIIWGMDASGKVYEWVNGRWEERLEYGKAKRIALSPNGEAYTIKVE